MSDLSELILVEPSIRKEFLFHKINTHKTNRYHISTIDQDNRDYSFDMEYNSNRWKIIDAPKVPSKKVSKKLLRQEKMLNKLSVN